MRKMERTLFLRKKRGYMTEQELEKFLYQTVRIHCVDGDILEGFVFYYADAESNSPEEAGIIIEKEKHLKRDVSVSLSEIKTIEVI